MTRAALIIVALFGIGLAGVIGYSGDTSTDSVDATADDALPAAAQDAVLSAQSIAMDIEQTEAATFDQTHSPRTIAADTVEKWITEATGDDPRTRAAAIDALATAPKSQALPILQKVLGAGIDTDRQLAVNSLRTLALHQGDDAGEVRNVLRLTIYDGDDEAVASSAQVALADIERELR
jgi:hypothetical protein